MLFEFSLAVKLLPWIPTLRRQTIYRNLLIFPQCFQNAKSFKSELFPAERLYNRSFSSPHYSEYAYTHHPQVLLDKLEPNQETESCRQSRPISPHPNRLSRQLAGSSWPSGYRSVDATFATSSAARQPAVGSAAASSPCFGSAARLPRTALRRNNWPRPWPFRLPRSAD